MHTHRIRLTLLPLIVCSLWAQAPPPAPASAPAPAATEPPPLQTSITVTGRISAETPASLVVLGPKQIAEEPGVNLDDRLRQIPGFSLFRRSSSLVANPTTQGVSLRAIGSTGASRTLVLWDGVPLNDPFGGWVYWDRVDPNYIDRIEIVPGANTAIFGYDAMDGAISLFSPPIEHQHAQFSYFGGNAGIEELSGAYSNLWGRFGVSTNFRGMTSDGYYITPASIRGTVDDKANSRFATGILFLDYLGSQDRLSLSFDVLAEARNNGTVLQKNSTGLGTLAASYTHSWQNDEFSFIGDRTQEQYHSTFSAISLNRDFERLTSRQTVPAFDNNGGVFWHHHNVQWNTTVGADADDAHGTSYDYSYATRILSPSGGTLLQHGIFAQGDLKWGPARFYAGIRQQFTGLGGIFISPNGGVTVGLGQFRLRASAYRSDRTPTLNELYRQFRVGNALTLANPNLVPERLLGVESGFDWIAENNRLSLTLFHEDLSQLILNHTLSTSPTLILRQRENASSGLSEGLQSSYQYKWHDWTADLNYMYADAHLSTGPLLAQVPKQQGTGGLTYSRDSTLVSFGVRAFGLQFDDDLNQFLLPGYAALELAAQQRITHGWFAQAAVENLLDRQYLVALTPTPNTGSPRLWRLGLRWTGNIH